MKKITLVLIASVFCLAAKAQVQYGVEGGINFSKLNNPKIFTGWHGKVGYHASAYINIPVKYGFSIQPGAMYSQEGAYLAAEGQKVYVNFNFFYVPVLLKYTHTSGLFAEAGPQFGNLTTASITEGTEGGNVKSLFMHNNFNWVAGLGYNFGFGLGVHVRYNLGMSNLAKNSSGEDLTLGNLKTRDLQAGVFYNIAHLINHKIK